MSKFLNIQCRLSRLKYPPFAKKWINIRKSYGNFYKILGFFHLLAVVNTAPVNVDVQITESLLSVLWVYTQKWNWIIRFLEAKPN
ncbi:3'-5' exoribonuclease 1 [Leptonychotes weddellii]|uniref:3'-5' exoribonuclease 1 n=2 Tax=Monachinae TaxID=3410119 RepID=A0A7F8RK46_LEPWE|nr:3'-5' exoribonuclease 1 [Leptonychotes weddellii]